MKTKTLFVLATLSSAVATMSVPDAVSAQSAQASPPMERWVCRRSSETYAANATLKESDAIELSCRPITIAVSTSGRSLTVIGTAKTKMILRGPDYSSALTPAQMNDAWAAFVRKTFQTDGLGGG